MGYPDDFTLYLQGKAHVHKTIRLLIGDIDVHACDVMGDALLPNVAERAISDFGDMVFSNKLLWKGIATATIVLPVNSYIDTPQTPVSYTHLTLPTICSV